eukprot:11977576-Prorocentrum_lima.AAC.1
MCIRDSPEDCRYPLAQGVPWTCPGCIARHTQNHRSHTFLPHEFKHFEEPKGRERQGAHPRAPRVPD